MLERFRQHSRSTLIYVLFAILIAVFLLTFNVGGPTVGPTQTAEVFAEVDGAQIDSRQVALGMQLSADPAPAGAGGFEKFQAQQRYERTRLAYAGGPAELATLLPFEAAVPPVKLEKIVAELIESELVAADARKHGLAVSDAELSRRVLALQRVFGTDLKDENGKFDPRKYDVFVRFTLGTSKTGLEEFLRREILRDKMATVVTAGITVTPAEVEAMLAADAKRPRLEVVSLDAVTAAAAVTVTDDEANAWAAANADKVKAAYEAKGEKYVVADKYNVRGILVQASEADRAAKKAAADALRADLDKAWTGEVAVEPPAAASPEAAAPAAEPKKATELPPEERNAWLFAHFAKVAGEKTEHMMTKDQGGLFVDDKAVKDFERTPFGPAVAAAMATAEEGQLVGPVEGNQGWWVLVVEKKIPGKATPLESVQTELAREVLQQERAAAELDRIAGELLAAAKARPKDSLEAVVKDWNRAHGGDEDGPLSVVPAGPVGKSPLAALQGGIEEMLGLPPREESPDDVPGVGKVPALAKAAWTLSAESPVAAEVFKSEDGKTRYVVRHAAQKDEADAKAKEGLTRTLLQLRRAEAYKAYVKKLRQQADADKDVKLTDAYAVAVQQEREKLVAAAKRAPAAPATPPIQLNVGGQEVPVAPSPGK